MHDFRTPLFLAATYGRLGRIDEGARQVAVLRERWEAQYETSVDLDVMRNELIARHAFAPGLADDLLAGAAKAGFVESLD